MESFLDPSPPTYQEIDDALLDFGFYHSFHEVTRMYAEYVNNGNYAYGSGRDVLGQPDEYWHDMATMYWLKMWVTHIKPAPRLEETSWIDNIREHGTLNGKFKNGNS